jgi:hypothetical protein
MSKEDARGKRSAGGINLDELFKAVEQGLAEALAGTDINEMIDGAISEMPLIKASEGVLSKVAEQHPEIYADAVRNAEYTLRGIEVGPDFVTPTLLQQQRDTMKQLALLTGMSAEELNSLFPPFSDPREEESVEGAAGGRGASYEEAADPSNLDDLIGDSDS